MNNEQVVGIDTSQWKPLTWIVVENAQLIHLELTADGQAKLNTLMERYTSWGASDARRVHRWWLAQFMLVMEDTENHNDVSDIRYDKWPLATWVDSPIFRWLREIFLPMLVKEHAEYPEPDQDDES